MKRLNNRLRVAELADVSARLVEIYKSETSLAEDSFFKPLFDQIKEQALALSIAIKKENAISKLEELDEQRDNTIRDLKNALVGYASLRTAEIRESAEQLLTIFERYGLKVIRENYASQSGHIDSMLRDFSRVGTSVGGKISRCKGDFRRTERATNRLQYRTNGVRKKPF